MKITYVCADSGVSLAKNNGSAAHLRAIVDSFVELGHQVEVVMSNVDGCEMLEVPVHPIVRTPFAGALNKLARAPQAGEHQQTTAVLRALRRIWCNSAVEDALTERLERSRPDLVYERHSPFSVAGPVAARRMGCPHVLEVNAPLSWEGARHRGQALHEAAEVLERLAFEATSRIVAVSDDLREQLIAGGVDAAKIQVVPNGVDVGRFRPDGPALPVELAGRLVVGFVGSLKPWHGIDVLVEAFARLASDPSLHLLVVGDGPMAERLEDLQRSLPDQVTLTGSVPPTRVPAYLRAMDIAVAPYPAAERFYFSPLKVLEYMASGTAVVASRIGQLRQLIRHGETGLLVEPGSVPGLIDAVRLLARDGVLRRRLGSQAHDEALRRHTWTQRASEILSTLPLAA
ncbi:MAG TPA: glycosyltransferase family 4 protein [Thermoanaerobaculia bacterium]|nr:glycosyltransferase family 4 protein [Thermoanaerobaculia bacterium]